MAGQTFIVGTQAECWGEDFYRLSLDLTFDVISAVSIQKGLLLKFNASRLIVRTDVNNQLNF